jgi:DNA-binding SARP family transcriptional activator/tetratricopeptide (TPR) repeat protein
MGYRRRPLDHHGGGCRRAVLSAAVARAEVRVLGPVDVAGPDGVVGLPSASQRRLLAALAVHAPQPVRSEWLAWVLGISPGALRKIVARVRSAVGADLIVTTATGYRLDAPVDALLAVDELERAGGDPDLLRCALDRWRGPALDEFRDEAWANGETTRLDEVRATAVEDLAEVLLQRGRWSEAISTLAPHIHDNEFRDRPRGLLMRAQAAAGRRTEALRSFRTYRSFLGEQAGLEPSADLRRVEQRIATGWNGLDPYEPDGSDSGPPSGRRQVPAIPAPLVTTKPIVGRRRELEALVGVVEEAEGAGSRTVLVSGESGIGKSSLLAAVASICSARSDWSVFYGRCAEIGSEPFQPFGALLGHVVDALAEDEIAAHAARCGGDLARIVPQLRSRVPEPTTAVVDDPGTARHLLFHAAADIVRRVAATGPVALLVDDLHWAEPSGLELLRQLVADVAGLPVLLVGTFRDTGDARGEHLRTTVTDLARSGATHVPLHGMHADELVDLVRTRVEGAAVHDVGDVVELLEAETAGNPLFAEHLLRFWSESHRLSLDDTNMTLGPVRSGPLPATLRDLVWQRVGVLGPESRAVLSAAAVLGVEFDESALGAMVQIDADTLGDVLDRATAAGVIAPGDSRDGSARFTHAVVARSLESELGSRARARLHSAALDVLSALDRAHAPAAQLTHHAERAGRRADAQRWARVAGDEALAGLAAQEAVGWYRRALDHARALDRPPAELADLTVCLGDAATRAGDPTALDILQEGAALAQAHGNYDALRHAALAMNPGSVVRFGAAAPQQLAIAEAALASVTDDDLATRARLEALVAHSLVHTDQTQRRAGAAAAALESARATGDPTVLVRIAPAVVTALWAPGNASVRAAIAAEAEGLVEAVGDPMLTASVYFAAHTAAVCAGDAAAALHSRVQLRRVADELGEPRALWLAGLVDTFTATMTCRFRDAEQCVAETYGIGERMGEVEAFPVFAGQSFVIGTFEGRHDELLPLVEPLMDGQQSVDITFRVAHAICCFEVGETAVPRALLREAFDRGIDAIPDDLIRSTTLLGYSILALDLEDAAAAAVLLPAIEPFVDEVSFNGVTSQGPVAAYVGKLLTLLGRHEEAERRLLEALTMVEAFGWEYHRASTLIALAQNRVAGSGPLDAVAERWLALAEELCAVHGLASWARRAAALRAMH